MIHARISNHVGGISGELVLEKKKKRFTLCCLPAESTYEHFAAEKQRKYFYLGDTVIVSFLKTSGEINAAPQK